MSFFIALLDSMMIFLMLLLGMGCGAILTGIPYPRSRIAACAANFISEDFFYNYWFLASMVFLFIAFLSVFFRRIRSTPVVEDVVVVSRKGNTLQISSKAITEHITKIVKSIEGVHSVNVKVVPVKHDKILVRVFISLWDGSSYPEINDQIQALVRTKTAADLGVDNIKSIPVILDKIIQSKTTPLPVEDEVVIDQ